MVLIFNGFMLATPGTSQETMHILVYQMEMWKKGI